jgi:hypothetical protein
MSFLYLLNSEKKDIDSLYLLNDLMLFAKPRYVGLTLSEQEYTTKYESYARSKRFQDEMKRLEYFLKAKKSEEIEKLNGKLRFLFFLSCYHFQRLL